MGKVGFLYKIGGYRYGEIVTTKMKSLPRKSPSSLWGGEPPPQSSVIGRLIDMELNKTFKDMEKAMRGAMEAAVQKMQRGRIPFTTDAMARAIMDAAGPYLDELGISRGDYWLTLKDILKSEFPYGLRNPRAIVPYKPYSSNLLGVLQRAQTMRRFL